MYTCNDPAYIQSLAIKKGEYHLPAEDAEIVDWINNTWQVPALNFYFYTVETSKGYRLQHACIILERFAECKKMEDVPGAEAAIAERFIQYFNQYRLTNTDPLKKDIFPPENGVYPEMHVAFRPLEAIELELANRLADKEIKDIAGRYKDIWTISTNMNNRNVFYYTEAQRLQHRENGTDENIRNDILLLLKKHDRFGYFGTHSLQVYFDSKESFDRDYDGNWYYYYK